MIATLKNGKIFFPAAAEAAGFRVHTGFKVFRNVSGTANHLTFAIHPAHDERVVEELGGELVANAPDLCQAYESRFNQPINHLVIAEPLLKDNAITFFAKAVAGPPPAA